MYMESNSIGDEGVTWCIEHGLAVRHLNARHALRKYGRLTRSVGWSTADFQGQVIDRGTGWNRRS